MMKSPILLFLALFLFGCQTPQSPDVTFPAMHSHPPISQQYAENIGPDTYRIHNIFTLSDGEIRNLGHFDISIGQTIRVPGTSEISIQEIEVKALEAKNGRLHLHSTYLFDREPPASHLSSSIPIHE